MCLARGSIVWSKRARLAGAGSWCFGLGGVGCHAFGGDAQGSPRDGGNFGFSVASVGAACGVAGWPRTFGHGGAVGIRSRRVPRTAGLGARRRGSPGV